MVMKFLDRLPSHIKRIQKDIQQKQVELQVMVDSAAPDLRRKYDDLQEEMDDLEFQISRYEDEIRQTPEYKEALAEVEALVDEEERLENYAKQNNVQVST